MPHLLNNKKKPFNKQYGFTLTEMLVSLAIAGIFAVLTIPKVISSPQERDAQIKQQTVSMIQQQLNFSILTYQQQNSSDDTQLRADIAANLATVPDIYYFYGNFFAYKNVSNKRYFYFTNKTRLSFDPTFFTVGDYDASSIPVAVRDDCVARQVANTGYCAIIDFNGRTGPNVYTPTGDISILMVDGTNFTVKPL